MEPLSLLKLWLISQLGVGFQENSFSENSSGKKQSERGEGGICLQSDLATVLPSHPVSPQGHWFPLSDIQGWVLSQANLYGSNSPRNLAGDVIARKNVNCPARMMGKCGKDLGL